MAQVELTKAEMRTLKEILQRHLAELLPEIAFTHRKDYIQFLRKRKEFIEDFIRRLEREQASGTGGGVSVDRLRKIDFLQGLEEEELQSISQFFEEKNAAAGVTLCEEGAGAERLFVLEEGGVSIRSKTGRRYSIESPGRIVGWSFLVPPFLYTASAVTTAPSKLLVIESPDFYYVLHKEPRMGMKVINNLAQVVASRLI